MTPFLGSIHLPEWLRELRKALYSLITYHLLQRVLKVMS